MAFLVAGTLRLAMQMADTQDSLGRKVAGGTAWPSCSCLPAEPQPSPALALPPQGKYDVQGPRAALMLSSPGVVAAAVTALEDVFQALGFESCERREVPVQGFLKELAWFQKQLDAHGRPVGCALVALVAPRGQLRQPQQLVRELSSCRALRGCPKVFLLLSSGPGSSLEPGAFLAGLRELCGHSPCWSLVQLLTELFRRVAEESTGGTCCPVLRSSLRGALCLGGVEPWRPEPAPGPSTQYDLSKARAALLLAVIQGRPGAQHDVEALGGLCRALGFETTVRTDPTAQVRGCRELPLVL
ncbi:uncharacterized protein LOC115831203 [Nomascus leucogenys]|uniref:uncharacterized protein LOC115831203 n=1 Tax=Nomascus leucogenys TaxID=61853 RepID=UPI00122D5527|nr:uncharacterized protein LOC115831203 [Nomascus leucogenys]